MKIFISWSGERSCLVAEALRKWLKTIIQAVDPWMSKEDINKGGRWGTEMAEQLEKAKFGIICLTEENKEAPWILFEAGALSKVVGSSFVCPYLLDLKPTDIKEPLGLFQSTRFDKTDTRKLLDSINQAQEEKMRLPKDILDTTFERGWPELEESLNGIPPAKAGKGSERPERELLEEILTTVRGLAREDWKSFLMAFFGGTSGTFGTSGPSAREYPPRAYGYSGTSEYVGPLIDFKKNLMGQQARKVPITVTCDDCRREFETENSFATRCPECERKAKK